MAPQVPFRSGVAPIVSLDVTPRRSGSDPELLGDPVPSWPEAIQFMLRAETFGVGFRLTPIPARTATTTTTAFGYPYSLVALITRIWSAQP